MADTEEPDHTKLTPRELYEKPPLYKEDPDLEVPYPLLCGEHVIRVGKTADAVVVLSKYRLFVKYKKSFTNIPVRLVEHLDARENVLILHCKDGKTFKVKFSSDDQCQQWCLELHSLSRPPAFVTELFAFCFHAWCFSEKGDGNEAPGMAFLKPENAFEYNFRKEVERLGFNIGNAWRVYTNAGFKLSPTYPEQHIVPSGIVDDDIRKMCKFRSKGRFPSVVWRHPRNGAVIVRCGQPEVGVFNWRCKEDEKLIDSFLQACYAGVYQPPGPSIMNGHAGSSDKVTEGNNLSLVKSSLPPTKRVLIVDLRSYTAAYGNKLKGGGWEYEEYYETSETIFMGLVNIHSIRKSFQSLRILCSSATESSSNWLSKLESTEWLNHLALLLKSAHLVVNGVHKEGRPTVIHCSDGWDRTTQVVALAEIMMDPYYRTLEGIQVLIEREWLDFGHQFATRCGHDTNDGDPNQRSPVFLQWLDCLHQLLKQFPTAFEFNETFLIKLAEHVYSCLFGTFLCNTKRERLEQVIQENTCSVWAILHVDAMINTNFLYDCKTEQVLHPSWNVCDLHFWSKMYLSDSWRSEVEDGSSSGGSHGDSTITSSPKLPRARSFDDIHKTASEETERRSSFVETCSLGRTSSDPNLSDLRLEEIVGTPPKGTFMLASMIDEQAAKVKQVTANNLVGNGESLAETTGGQENGNSNHVKENGWGEEGEERPAPSPMLRSMRKEEAINELHMQSSTDTVTEDTNGHNGSVNGLCNGYHNEDLSVQDCETEGGSRDDGPGQNHLVLRKSSSISTSTSDISSSHIEGSSGGRFRGSRKLTSNGENVGESRGTLRTLKVKTGRSDLQPHSGVGPYREEEFSPSLSKSYSFSGGPRSPGAAGSHCPLPRRLDEDGLTNVTTASHRRILEMIVQSEQEKESMHEEIERLREQLQRYQTLDIWHDYRGIPDRPLSAELGCNLVVEEDELKPSSVPNSLHSDTSWEQLDDREPGQTLWVPDHAVNQCQQCGSRFGIITRRHHCRNCGRIFCGACSNYFIAIPREQLYQPQRVCKDCHGTLQDQQPHTIGLCSSETSLEGESSIMKVVTVVGQG